MNEEDEITPPNSPRRRRITTNGTSKVIKLHSVGHGHSQDTVPPPSLSLVAVAQGMTSTNSVSLSLSVPSSSQTKTQGESTEVSDIVTWKNLRDQTKTIKIEKFLWDANISDEIGKTDNLLLKEVLIDCTIKHLKSRPIQMRGDHSIPLFSRFSAYQLLQDLTLGTTIQPFYSEDEIQQRFQSTIETLKHWKSNEYVTAAAFEYLAALYFKNVKHDYLETNKDLLELVGEGLKNLKKSKAVIRSLMAFLAQIYQYLETETIQSPQSLNLIPYVIQMLQDNPEEKTITYQSCSILRIISTKCPSAIHNHSEGIVTTILHVLSFHHKNVDICGSIFGILSACAFEENHVSYLLTQKLAEFQFMCHSIQMFQNRGDLDTIEAVLLVIKRCVNSECMLELSETVSADIRDAIRTTLTHRQDCPGNSQCLEKASCGITENHASLCTAISNALASENQVATQSFLNSETKEESPLPVSPNEEISDLENDPESEEETKETNIINHNEIGENNQIQSEGEEKTTSPEVSMNLRPILPIRRVSESQLDDPLAFFRRKDEHQTQVIKHLQSELQNWKDKYEELVKSYETTQKLLLETQQKLLLDQNIQNSKRQHVQENKMLDESPNREEIPSHWSPIHVEEEYHDFQGDVDEIDNPADGNYENDEKSYGSVSAFDVNDTESNVGYFPENHSKTRQPLQQHKQQMEITQHESSVEVAFKDIQKEEANAVSLGLREALEYVSQSQIKSAQKLQASLAVLELPIDVPRKNFGSNLLELYPIEPHVEMEVTFVMVHLFKYLHTQLCASAKHFGQDKITTTTLPRNVVRRTLLDFLNLSQQKRLTLSEIDIVLRTVPTQLNLKHVSFVFTVCACKRMGFKQMVGGPVTPFIIRYLEAINGFCSGREIFVLSRALGPLVSSQRSDLIFTSEAEITTNGLKLMEKDETSFLRMFSLYSHHSQHFSLEAALQLARDFNICPQLFETGELISLYRKVFIESPVPTQVTKNINYYKFKLFLIEIALSCNCFGEEHKESKKDNVRVLTSRMTCLLWYLENSTGYEKMLRRDRSLPVATPFKLNRQVLVLDKSNPGKGAMTSKVKVLKRKGGASGPNQK